MKPSVSEEVSFCLVTLARQLLGLGLVPQRNIESESDAASVIKEVIGKPFIFVFDQSAGHDLITGRIIEIRRTSSNTPVFITEGDLLLFHDETWLCGKRPGKLVML